MIDTMRKQIRGQFITFEGTEGVGKTTAIAALGERLDVQGIHYLCTREPGGSPFAEQLRHLLLDPQTDIEDDTELLMMFAARSDHLHKVILPALKQGQWVICDRFVDSTVAYQGYGRSHSNAHMLAKIESLITQFVPCLPDLTLWLDLPINDGMTRAGRRSQADRFEQESQAFFSRVYEGFRQQHNADPNRVWRIDARGEPQEVATRIWSAVTEKIMFNK